MKNKTIRETLDSKVWRAIDAMIEGLEEYSKLPYFKIKLYGGEKLYSNATKKEVAANIRAFIEKMKKSK